MNDVSGILVDDAAEAVPMCVVDAAGLDAAAGRLGPLAAAWVAAAGYRAVPGTYLLVPAADGALAGVIVGAAAVSDPFGPLSLGRLTNLLPPGAYRLATPPERPDLAALGWLLGAYRFQSYRGNDNPDAPARLIMPQGVSRAEVERMARGCHHAMDLINTPANDLGPAVLAESAKNLAASYGAQVIETVGDELLDANLPLIHAVGRAGPAAPRLVDFTWGDAACPKITLVGKGVTFDTGGLDIKPSSAMLLMKKDMGGAAMLLGLARMIMDADLRVRLRVLVPIVENSISATSFRPGDVIRSRKGLTVEIGNTDAEGRLILADALTLGDEEAPELMIDMATLTVAARVALGPDVPPFYTHDDDVAQALAGHAREQSDPVWRMPLWPPYDTWNSGQVGDITNAPEKPFAGSIIAALFLSRFVERAQAHIHFDVYAWSPQPRAHAPRGGAAQAIRALYTMIRDRYGA